MACTRRYCDIRFWYTRIYISVVISNLLFTWIFIPNIHLIKRQKRFQNQMKFCLIPKFTWNCKNFLTEIRRKFDRNQTCISLCVDKDYFENSSNNCGKNNCFFFAEISCYQIWIASQFSTCEIRRWFNVNTTNH